MQINLLREGRYKQRFLPHKFILVMKITTFILLACFMQVTAKVTAQISISERNVPISSVLARIQQQSGYNLFYEDTKIKDVKINVNFNNIPLIEALERVLKNQALAYELVDKTIVIKTKEPSLLDKAGVILNSVQDLFQRIDVSGTVYDEKGLPLPGATVKVKGLRTSVVTDKDGKFYLPGVDDKAMLVVSYVGYADEEVAAKAEVSVSLEQKSDELQEVVVAYGKQEQRAITGAVTVVKKEQIESSPYLSVDKSLQTVVPGLLVTQGTGQPGGGTGNFVLRGISTGGSVLNGATPRNPLFVIDGVPVQQDPAQATTSQVAFSNPMAQLNPADIESVSVLKDASAIALYGSKASNGVILVTTKRGKAGMTTVNLRHQTDIAGRLAGTMKPLNQQQYMELLFETYKNTDAVRWTDAAIIADLAAKFPHKNDASGIVAFYDTPDWIGELYNKNAVTSINNLSFSGGSEKSNFYLNLEYANQNGIEKKSGYDRKSIRFNYENKPSEWFRIGLNTTLSYNVQNYGGGLGEESAARISPLNAIRDSNGDYIYHYTWGMSNSESTEPTGMGTLSANPVVAANLDIHKNISYRGLSNLIAEIKFLRNFSFATNLGVNFMLTETKDKHHPALAWSSYPVGSGSFIGNDLRTANLISTNSLRYGISREKHHMDLMLAHEAQVLSSDFKFIQIKDFGNNPLLEDPRYQAGTVESAYGQTQKQTLLSYFGQANYAYLNRYFLTGSIRTDGSSLFGDNKRFGTHWSAGTAWLVSSEQFFKSFVGTLNYLKLRGSIGSAGNSSAIDFNGRYDVLVLGNYAGQPTVSPNDLAPGNPDIQWEKTFSWNLGVELRLFKDRLSITGDFYRKKTNELIASVGLPLGTGFRELRDNIGTLENKGIELTVAFDLIRTKKFGWNLNSIWSTNKNVLLNSYLPLERSVFSSRQIANGIGKNYNSFYMPTWAGVNPDNGKPQWLDKDGRTTSKYSEAKEDFVGKPQPDGFGSLVNTLRYRSFELSATLYYQYAFKIYNQNASALLNDGVQPYINQGTGALDRWQKPGDIASNPRRLLFGRDGTTSDDSTRPSTRYLFDGDFLRLSNVLLTYTFERELISRFHLNGLRLFVQGNNLKTWTKYKGNDPENASSEGMGRSLYPLSRSFSFGMNVNF